MTKLLSFFFAFFLTTVSVFGQIDGFYTRPGMVMASASICLESGRFDYMFKGDVSSQTSTGEYKVQGDTIILTSDLRISDLIQVKQRAITVLDSIYISILTVSQQNPFETTLLINGSQHITISHTEEQMVKVPLASIETLSVRSFMVDWHINNLEFQISEGTTLIEIVLDDTKGIWNAFFENEKFLIQRGRLMNVLDDDFVFLREPNGRCN